MITPDLLSAFSFSFARAMGALSFLGPLLGPAGGLPLRVSLAMLFACSHPSSRPLDPAGLIGELILGLCMAAPFIAALEAASALGNLIDNGRGQNMAAMLSPHSESVHQGPELPLRVFQAAHLLCTFAPLHILAAYERSFSIVTAGDFPPPNWSRGLMQVANIFWEAMIRAGALYFPIALLFLAIDFALGSLAKICGLYSLQHELFLLKLIASIWALQSCSWLGSPASGAATYILQVVKYP